MKNKSNILLILPLIVFIAMGCGLIERGQQTGGNSSAPTVSNNNKSATDRAVEQVADGETTGVKECDEAIRFVNEQLASPDDNWMTKGFKDYAAGQIKKSIRESIAQNQDDQKAAAEQCSALRKSFEKSIKEEQEKQKQ